MADELKEQGRRLEATRLALGYETQVGFCKAIGVAKNTYNPFERGARPITSAVAKKIKRRFNIGLNWTLDGDPQDLPPRLYAKLGYRAA